MSPTQSRTSLNGIVVELTQTHCGESKCQEQHPNVKAYSAVIRLDRSMIKIGHVRLYTLDKATMDTIDAGQMLEEALAFDDMHSGAQINKIENFLSNETFFKDRANQLDEAQRFVFVEEVWLEEVQRGRGRGLVAVRSALSLLGLPSKSVIFLQADSTDSSRYNVFEADKKLTRHWAKLGFGVWSDSDPAWLCLSLQDEVYGLVALHDQPGDLAERWRFLKKWLGCLRRAISRAWRR